LREKSPNRSPIGNLNTNAAANFCNSSPKTMGSGSANTGANGIGEQTFGEEVNSIRDQ
jgi:hypothetical protein